MALYIPHSIFHLARLLYVRPETFGPYYVHLSQRFVSKQQDGLSVFVVIDSRNSFVSLSLSLFKLIVISWCYLFFTSSRFAVIFPQVWDTGQYLQHCDYLIILVPRLVRIVRNLQMFPNVGQQMAGHAQFLIGHISHGKRFVAICASPALQSKD